jgi:hypothetical protein
LKSLTILAVVIVITFVCVSAGFVSAASPADYLATGGAISGTVVGPTGTVVDWAQIYANGENHTYEAFSGFSGFYLMRVPAGTYNVSVYDFYNPSYWAPNVTVTVTDGSTNAVNFYLQYPGVTPLPEFSQSSIIVYFLGLAAVCVVARRFRKRSASS